MNRTSSRNSGQKAKDRRNKKILTSQSQRFQISEISFNPKSACNTYESRGTGLGCRC